MSFDLDDQRIKTLASIISDRARQDLRTTGEYIDSGENLLKIGSSRHVVVYGRRGSGKTTLLKTLTHKSQGKAHIWIDADEYKHLSYPETIIQLFRAIIREIIEILNQRTLWTRFRTIIETVRVRRQLRKFDTELHQLLGSLEQATVTFEQESGSAHRLSAAIETGRGHNASVGSESRTEDKRKKVAKGVENKEQAVARLFQDFKVQIKAATRLTKAQIYLILDDFYHLRIEDQAKVLDYLGRLCKNISIYIKFGTIFHRTSIYRRGITIEGFQIGHDVDDINLDRSFKNFDAVDGFLRKFWNVLCTSAGIADAQEAFKGLFAGASWRQLVLASGGVPRDFLNILGRCIEYSRSRQKKQFEVRIVNEAANSYYRETKRQDLEVDSKADTRQLTRILRDIQQYCMDTKKQNVVLIDLAQLEQNPGIEESIRQLCDFRFLHEVHDAASSVNKPGARFKALLLDVGLYAHPEKRGDNKVKEIEFWDRDEGNRQDAIRKAPIYEIKADYSAITDDPFAAPQESPESSDPIDREPDLFNP